MSEHRNAQQSMHMTGFILTDGFCINNHSMELFPRSILHKAYFTIWYTEFLNSQMFFLQGRLFSGYIVQ